jgi:hypothetical protein
MRPETCPGSVLLSGVVCTRSSNSVNLMLGFPPPVAPTRCASGLQPRHRHGAERSLERLLDGRAPSPPQERSERQKATTGVCRSGARHAWLGALAGLTLFWTQSALSASARGLGARARRTRGAMPSQRWRTAARRATARGARRSSAWTRHLRPASNASQCAVD